MTNPITTLSRERLEEMSQCSDVTTLFAYEMRHMARALLAVMDARERPSLFAICNPDGSAWLDENCVADTENNLKPVLNDLRRDSGDDYYISPLYTTPPAPSAPDGWKLVPVEPTIAMTEAAIDEFNESRNMRDTYYALLEHAPAPVAIT